jgi:hypothetical protein
MTTLESGNDIFLMERDCIGPNGDTTQDLETEVSQMYQEAHVKKNTLCARCVFIPTLGKWKIMDFNGSLERAKAIVLINTLEKIATLISKNKKKRKFDEIQNE